LLENGAGTETASGLRAGVRRLGLLLLLLLLGLRFVVVGLLLLLLGLFLLLLGLRFVVVGLLLLFLRLAFACLRACGPLISDDLELLVVLGRLAVFENSLQVVLDLFLVRPLVGSLFGGDLRNIAQFAGETLVRPPVGRLPAAC